MNSSFKDGQEGDPKTRAKKLDLEELAALRWALTKSPEERHEYFQSKKRQWREEMKRLFKPGETE